MKVISYRSYTCVGTRCVEEWEGWCSSHLGMNPSLVAMSSEGRKHHDSPKVPAVALCLAHNPGSMCEELQGAQGRISA